MPHLNGTRILYSFLIQEKGNRPFPDYISFLGQVRFTALKIPSDYPFSVLAVIDQRSASEQILG
ncbi:MAG TPA: hypothetical protein DEF45_20305 [Rhodopirellula sp.]|nr:MAG: hypothetical protein CBD74_05730 [Saprospirales bacterium TMED214]HBV65355.1 hypothetical protein [Rhodopirellula sp.]